MPRQSLRAFRSANLHNRMRRSAGSTFARSMSNSIAVYRRDRKHKILHSSFLISLGVHVVILSILALIVIQELRPEEISITSRMDDNTIVELDNTSFEIELELEREVTDSPRPNVNEFLTPKNKKINFDINSLLPPVRDALNVPRTRETFDNAVSNSNDADDESVDPSAGIGEFQSRLKRAGAKAGDVQVSLIWNNGNDLDLHVICPSGERIWFGHKRSHCAGHLDVDMNADGPTALKPVENVFWPHGGSPKGQFQVWVHHFANHRFRDPTPFRVAIKVAGQTMVFRGNVVPGQLRPVYRFNFPATKAQKRKQKAQQDRNERAAQHRLDEVKKKYLKSRPQLALIQLEKIIADYPRTKAARDARELIRELSEPQPR